MSILTGSLYLGPDVSWQGEHVLSDLCLYTDESTEQSQVFDVNFHLEAIIHLTAVKMFMLKRDRWRASILESNSGLNGFLRQLFNEEVYDITRIQNDVY
ncbi:hypothetical protein BD770DRAFT_15876 [Pilaira anomala]|nr:hypothetical protein BD770DRAFT_15876 [Pilaira anomala]